MAIRIEGEVTAAASDQLTRLEAAGHSVRWHVEDFAAAVAGLPVADRPALSTLADRLQAAGLTFEVIDRGRPILVVGSTGSSLLGRLAFGDPRFRPRRLWRWARISRAARRAP